MKAGVKKKQTRWLDLLEEFDFLKRTAGAVAIVTLMPYQDGVVGPGSFVRMGRAKRWFKPWCVQMPRCPQLVPPQPVSPVIYSCISIRRPRNWCRSNRGILRVWLNVRMEG